MRPRYDFFMKVEVLKCGVKIGNFVAGLRLHIAISDGRRSICIAKDSVSTDARL